MVLAAPGYRSTQSGKFVVMRGWTSVTLIGMAFAIAMLGTTLPTPLYPLYEKAFHFGELVTTVVFAAYAAGVLHDTNHALTGAVVLTVFLASTIGQSLSSLIGEQRAWFSGASA